MAARVIHSVESPSYQNSYNKRKLGLAPLISYCNISCAKEKGRLAFTTGLYKLVLSLPKDPACPEQSRRSDNQIKIHRSWFLRSLRRSRIAKTVRRPALFVKQVFDLLVKHGKVVFDNGPDDPLYS